MAVDTKIDNLTQAGQTSVFKNASGEDISLCLTGSFIGANIILNGHVYFPVDSGAFGVLAVDGNLEIQSSSIALADSTVGNSRLIIDASYFFGTVTLIVNALASGVLTAEWSQQV